MRYDSSYPKKIDDINGYRLFYFNLLYKDLYANSMNQMLIKLLPQMTSFHNSSYFLEITITLLNQLFLSLRHQIRQTPFLQPLSWLALQRHQLFQTLRVPASVVLLVQAAIHRWVSS